MRQQMGPTPRAGPFSFRQTGGASAPHLICFPEFTPSPATIVGLFGIPDPHDVEGLMLQVFRSDRYPHKRKHDENDWADADDFVGDDTFEEELDRLIGKSSQL
jgi:hypothetical protein